MEPSRSLQRGFTLVELMVVLAIIIVITGVVLNSQGSFNKTLVLANTAYDVALTLRFTETYGLGSRVFSGTSRSTGYGLHFDKTSPNWSNSFIMFADASPSIGAAQHDSSTCHPAPAYDDTGPSALPGDCAYSGQSELVKNYTIGNTITIGKFCAYASNTWFCSTGASNQITSLDIVFSRPNPTPFMVKDGVYSATAKVTAACIGLTAAQGAWKYITVGSSGQISTNATSCP